MALKNIFIRVSINNSDTFVVEIQENISYDEFIKIGKYTVIPFYSDK